MLYHWKDEYIKQFQTKKIKKGGLSGKVMND